MTFSPHTDEDRQAILDAIGASSVAELFEAIPEQHRFPDLDLPPRLSEQQAYRRMSQLSSRNRDGMQAPSFLGAGSYTHYVPAAVQQLVFRGEFYTAYTPYQPEVAQGTLQAIYEYQTMISELTGMEVSNASLYDGATALAEGALLTVAPRRGRKRIVMSKGIHPYYREVVETYVSGIGAEVVDIPLKEGTLSTDIEALDEYLDDEFACVVIGYPNFFGTIEDLKSFADKAHDAGGMLVASVYPTSLGLLVPPGDLGADVVTGEGQPFGVGQNYGGPVVGLLATRQSLVRQMPGRLVGMTEDSEGKRGYVLALQTREQHIRREKATSNICTNQGLMALAATIYLATMGPSGLRSIAEICYHNAHYLAEKLEGTGRFNVVNKSEFFNEFTVKSDEEPASLNSRLAEAGIIGGLDLGRVSDSYAGHVLLSATELVGKSDIDRFVEIAAAS
ncbi:MAG: aminomethyl-transferring glycine dehydrogenase subunit GcvPA [Thermomicrobiales bacterium]